MQPTMGKTLYQSYMQPIHQAYANGIATPPVKQEIYAGERSNLSCLSYASIAGVDVSIAAAPSYHDVAAIPV